MTAEHQPDLRAEAERIASDIRARGGKVVWNPLLHEWMLPTKEANLFLGMGKTYLKDCRYTGGGPRSITWPPSANPMTGRKTYLIVDLLGYMLAVASIEKKAA